MRTKILLITYSLAIFFALVAVGCSNQKWPEEMDKLTFNENIQYELSAQIGQNLNLSNPASLLWHNDRLYISDMNNDRIVICDQNGNLIQEIGQTGNGPLEFIKPTGMAIDHNNNLYVVDSGNNRIQIISENGVFLREIKIKDFPYQGTVSHLSDIAVQDNLIILTARTLDPSWAKVFSISEDRVLSYGKKLIGHLASVDDKIILVTEGEFRSSKEGRSFESGRNYMVEVKQDGLGNVIELPYKYTPGDIQYRDQNIYMLSRAYGTIDQYNAQGEYVSTLYRFRIPVDEVIGLTAFTISDDGLFVLNSVTNSIYHLVRSDTLE